MLRAFNRYLKKEDGVTAIEFSLVALPMFLMIMGIIELSMFFGSTTVLEGASTEAARRIRTGQVAGVVPEGVTDPAVVEELEREAFEQLLCDNVGIMMDCNNIQYEVIHMNGDTFSDASNYEPTYDDEGNLIPHPFSVGDACDVIMVRTYVKREFLTPFVGSILTAGSDHSWVSQQSTVVIRTEPYDLSGTSCPNS